VSAADDAYVNARSMSRLHAAWEGSELRTVTGGHVSSYFAHNSTFATAVADSIQSLSTVEAAAATAAALKSGRPMVVAPVNN
jgi:hypothetical protein